MKMFKVLLLIIFSLNVHAQKISFESTDNNVIQRVVGEAAFMVRQDYYIVDTTSKTEKKLGLKNQKYFGRFYFLAIVANGHFYVSPYIKSPWNQDQNFKLLSSEKKYKPFLSDFAFKRLGDNQPFQTDSAIAKNIANTQLLNELDDFAAIKAPDSLKGLKVIGSNDASIIDSTSWFWVASTLSLQENDSINNITDSSVIQFETSKGRYKKSTNSFVNNSFFYNKKTIGGFIFITKPSFGKVEYFLKGIIVKKQDKFNFISIDDPLLKEINSQIPIIDSKKGYPKLTLTEIINATEKKIDKKSPDRKKIKH